MDNRSRVTMKLIKLKLQGPSLVWAPQALIAGGCGEFQVGKERQFAIRKHFYVNFSDKLLKDILKESRLTLQVSSNLS